MKKLILCAFMVVNLLLMGCGQSASKKAEEPADTSQFSPVITGGRTQMTTENTKQKNDTSRPRRTTLVLRDADAQLLDSSTVIGKPGDMLITFSGSGFAFTSTNPAVLVGNNRYDKTYRNDGATEMYVVIPAKEIPVFLGAMRGELRVVNPGAENIPASLKKEAAELKRKTEANARAVLVYTKFAVARRTAEKR